MQDVAALSTGMQKLAAAMNKNKEGVARNRAQGDSPRAPDREEDVEGSRLREPCASGACADKYARLRARLANLDNYELLHVDDAMMGINVLSSHSVKKHARDSFSTGLAIPEAAL